MNMQRTTLSPDIQKHMQQLEIHTRRLIKHNQIGQARSALKGSGFDFDQIRDYQMGDDVRFIDWKASARSNKMLVKQYKQERGRTLLIALDVSASTRMGHDTYNKWLIQADLGSVLALAGAHAHDTVGLILFSDRIEQYIPPQQNKSIGRFIMETIFSAQSKGEKTDFSPLLTQLTAIQKKNALLVIVSDFIQCANEQKLSIIGQLYDTIAIRCLMPQERSLVPNGFLTLYDAEYGKQLLLDTRQHKVKHINAFLHQRIEDQNKFLSRSGIDLCDITTGSDYVPTMITFFYQRMLSL